jgi:hypothetical protein
MRGFTLMARRSFGLTMLAAMVGIVLLHIFARERPWTHEWFWAAYQLNFVTVMLAPVVAGVAAWEGVRFARGRTLLETSNRVLAGLLGIWAALLVWVFLAYAIGLALVVVMVKLAGTPGLPELDALVAVIPALALLAAAGAIGLAIGWMVKNPLAAPACAVGCFLLILLLYLRGPGQLVIVGGATDSLLALRPRPELQAAQVLCYLACSFAALVLAAHTVGGSRRHHPGVLPALGSLAVLSVVLVVAQGGTILQPHTPRLRCYGANPEVCAGLGYVPRLSAARAALLPYLNVLETAGVPVPRRFSQGQEPGNPEVGPLSLRLLQGRRDEAGLLVMAAYFQKRCDLKANPGVIEAHQYASFWLEAKATGAQLDDPTIPRALRDGDPREQERWIRNAMRQIRRCGA